MQQGFDAGKIRQAQESSKPCARPRGRTVRAGRTSGHRLRVARPRRQQPATRRTHRKRNVDMTSAGWRRGCNHMARASALCRGEPHFALVAGPWLAFDARRQASPGEGTLRPIDIIELLDQPRQAPGPAQKAPRQTPGCSGHCSPTRSGCGPFAELVDASACKRSPPARSTFGKSLRRTSGAFSAAHRAAPPWRPA